MTPRSVRRLVIALGAALVGFIAVALMLPLIASTQIVRDRIAMELSVWSGLHVELGEAPSLGLWPSFRAGLSDVTFRRWDDADGRPVLSAERIEAGLSALSALRGDIVFTDLSLQRPVLRIVPHAPEAGVVPDEVSGRLAQSIAVARELVAASPAAPDMGGMPDDALGVVDFAEGRIEYETAGGRMEVASGLSGRVSWPALDRQLTGSASGIWRGEVVRLEVRSDRPLLLVAGGTAPLRIDVVSDMITGNFEGSASLSGGGYVDGTLALSSPSLRRLLEWSRRDMPPMGAMGAIELRGRMTGSAERLRIDRASLALEGSRSTGTLEVTPRGEIPSVSGTLAFETFDIKSFLSAFSALTPDPWGRWRAIDDSIADRIGIDLRLSAARATAGSLAFADLAATAQIRRGIAAFDISDATAFGGRVQAGMRVDRRPAGTEVEVRLRGEDIDATALARALGADRLVPLARGTFSLSLKGMGSELYSVVSTASGSMTASFGAGAMAGLDLPAFRRRAASGEFFALSTVGQGTLAFTGLELKATVDNGVARLEKALVRTADKQIALQGVVPLPEAALALSGSVSGPGSETPIPFFVGGSWETPYISPIAPPMQ
jgi:AsmA protein